MFLICGLIYITVRPAEHKMIWNLKKVYFIDPLLTVYLIRLLSSQWECLTSAGQMLLWLPPQRKMKNQSVVITKQKIDTNITQPRGLAGSTLADATRIHTKPPNTCRVTQRRGKETMIDDIAMQWLDFHREGILHTNFVKFFIRNL